MLPRRPTPIADLGRIEAKAIALNDENPVEIFGVGLRERVGNRRKAIKPGRSGFRHLGLVEQHRERRAPIAAA